MVEKAKQGGAILARPREYLVRVVLPSFGAWLAKLGVIAVFLAGYGITVSFHAVMSVMGGNSIANTVSVTPGGVGVNQATNVAALNDVTDAATATAYSLGQQLAITAWNIVFAMALVIWAFGWTGGKGLVEQSYVDAKVKVEQQKAQRAARRATRSAPLASASTEEHPPPDYEPLASGGPARPRPSAPSAGKPSFPGFMTFAGSSACLICRSVPYAAPHCRSRYGASVEPTPWWSLMTPPAARIASTPAFQMLL